MNRARLADALDRMSDVAAYLAWGAGLVAVTLPLIVLVANGTHAARAVLVIALYALMVVGCVSIFTALAAAGLRHDDEVYDAAQDAGQVG